MDKKAVKPVTLHAENVQEKFIRGVRNPSVSLKENLVTDITGFCF